MEWKKIVAICGSFHSENQFALIQFPSTIAIGIILGSIGGNIHNSMVDERVKDNFLRIVEELYLNSMMRFLMD